MKTELIRNMEMKENSKHFNNLKKKKLSGACKRVRVLTVKLDNQSSIPELESRRKEPLPVQARVPTHL